MNSFGRRAWHITSLRPHQDLPARGQQPQKCQGACLGRLKQTSRHQCTSRSPPSSPLSVCLASRRLAGGRLHIIMPLDQWKCRIVGAADAHIGRECLQTSLWVAVRLPHRRMHFMGLLLPQAPAPVHAVSPTPKPKPFWSYGETHNLFLSLSSCPKKMVLYCTVFGSIMFAVSDVACASGPQVPDSTICFQCRG